MVNGFKIDYLTAKGKKETIWLGSPISSFGSFDFSSDNAEDVVLMMFYQIYPSCRVLSIHPCFYEEYSNLEKW